MGRLRERLKADVEERLREGWLQQRERSGLVGTLCYILLGTGIAFIAVIKWIKWIYPRLSEIADIRSLVGRFAEVFSAFSPGINVIICIFGACWVVLCFRMPRRSRFQSVVASAVPWVPFVVLLIIARNADEVAQASVHVVNEYAAPEGYAHLTRAGTLAKRISGEMPRYTSWAKWSGASGQVTLALTIDKEGEVEGVRVIDGVGRAIEESAAAAVREWKFKPASLDNKPVKCVYRVSFLFRMQPPGIEDRISGPMPK